MDLLKDNYKGQCPKFIIFSKISHENEMTFESKMVLNSPMTIDLSVVVRCLWDRVTVRCGDVLPCLLSYCCVRFVLSAIVISSQASILY